MNPTSPDRFVTVIGVLILLAPVLVPAAFVLLLLLVLLGAMVVHAFAEGVVAGCAALGVLIGVPSVLILWLRAAGRVLHVPRRPVPVAAAPRNPTWPKPVAEAYAAGEFVHRDYDAEKREWEAERRAWEAELELRRAERARAEG